MPSFFFYFCNYFVITFFNAAIVACAFLRMEGGGEPSIGDGFREALARVPLIIGWAFLAATVGLVLRIIEDRSPKVGAFVAGLLGMAFSVVSFLVVPVLVIERKGPFSALKESTKLLKGTWGDQLVGNFSFGSIFGLLSLPAIILFAIAVGLIVSGHAIAEAALVTAKRALPHRPLTGSIHAASDLPNRPLPPRQSPGNPPSLPLRPPHRRDDHQVSFAPFPC